MLPTAPFLSFHLIHSASSTWLSDSPSLPEKYVEFINVWGSGEATVCLIINYLI